MEKLECASCKFWQRDGGDGICRGGTPQPQIVINNKPFVVMWPRTQSNEFCAGHSKVKK